MRCHYVRDAQEMERRRRGLVWMMVACLPWLVEGADEPVVEMGPVEVRGWIWDRNGKEQPAGVERLDRSGIEEWGAWDVTGVLARMSGVRVVDTTGNGAGGQVALRGFGENAGLRALILLDGHSMNPADMGGVTWGTLSLEDVEVIEVIRGGQGVLYGNQAVAGVIRVQTRFPEVGTSGRLRADVGGDGFRRLAASAGYGFGRGSVLAGANWQKSDGFRRNSSSEWSHGQIKTSWKTQAGGGWKAALSYSRGSYKLPGSLTYQQMLEDPRQSTSSSLDHGVTRFLQAQIDGQGQALKGKWTFLAATSLNRRQWDLSGTYADNDLLRMSLSPHLKWDWDSATVTVGATAQVDAVERSGYVEPARLTRRAWADLDRRTGAIYGYSTCSLNDDWELSGGVRLERAWTDNLYERYREEQLLPEIVTNRGVFPNPNYRNPPELDPNLSFRGSVRKQGWAAEINLLREIKTGMTLWGGWDRVYRYPALDESAAYQDYPQRLPFNPDLKPETGSNFEAGLKHSGRNWQLSATAFLMLRQNLNVGDSRRHGIENDWMYQLSNYGAEESLTWVRATLDDGSQSGLHLPLVPEWDFRFSLWMEPVRHWKLRATLRHLSSQLQGNDLYGELPMIPAYYFTDLAVSWSAAPGLDLHITVNNVLNQTYAVSAYSGAFYPGTGRQVIATLRYGF